MNRKVSWMFDQSLATPFPVTMEMQPPPARSAGPGLLPKMPRWLPLPILCSLGILVWNWPAAAPSPAAKLSASTPDQVFSQDPLPPEEIRSRARSLLANQHANDRAIQEYERVEHQMERSAGINPRVLDDKEFRVVPTGFGPFKILLEQDGNRVDNADYRRQLQKWEDVLKLSLNPSDSRAKELDAKYQKKERDRAELVDAMQDAFTPHWVGREMKNGRVCDVLVLDPNPEFHPRSLLEEVLTHVTVKIWVDHDSNQLVRGEANIARDIAVGGGIFGKLYRGGVFSMDQQEVSPGVWLPVRLQYDYTIRKFLFTSEEHQLMEASHYRRLGTPKEALAVVESELSKSTSDHSDP
jgi:hypothetical protein